MTSTMIDRRDGLSSSVAIKGPVRAATTANITLYGLQTIDGIALAQDDRVLVKNQTAGYENGIYIVDTGQWRRSRDFNKTNDVVKGTAVFVTDGTVYAKTLWVVTTENTVDVGNDDINFSDYVISPSDGSVGTAQLQDGAVTFPKMADGVLGPDVRRFGAKCDGVTSDAAAVVAMAAALGYVAFPHGICLLPTQTIDVPVYFGLGSSITVPAGQTVTIRNRINSPKQQIFKGAGTVRLDIVTNNGEDSRMTHASWWGVFPNGDNPAGNQTAAINKMFASFAQGREGVIDFDSGSYRVTWDGLDPLPRGVWLRGSGIRRTTFDMIGSSTSVSKMFRTGGTAGKITGIQFEHPAEDAASGHLGALISIDHDDWYVDDIRCWDTQFGVILNGNRCEAHNVQSIYGAAVDNSSATVVVRGSGCVVDNIRVNDTSNGPRDIVVVGLGATANIENTRVSNVRTTENSIGVAIRANNGINIKGTDIDGVMNTGDESSPVLGLVALITTQNGSINSAILSRLITNGTSAALVRIDQGSTAYTRDIVVASGQAIGSGNGIVLNQTDGSLTDITVSDAVDVSDRTAVIRTGTLSDIRLGSLVGAGSVTIADDAAVTIPAPAKGGFFKVKCMGPGDFPNYLCSGEIFYDAVTTVNNLKLTGGTNFAAVSSAVAGTTGTDGNVTIGVTSGNVQIENRTGALAVFEYMFE